jgi:hypothetical protein
MVSLVQKDVRDQRGVKATRDVSVVGSGENFTIGYHIMKVGVVNSVSASAKGSMTLYHDGGCG